MLVLYISGWLSLGHRQIDKINPEIACPTIILFSGCHLSLESLQQVIELYCCGPGLLFWLLLFQIRKGLGSWVFKVLLQRFCKTLYCTFQVGCQENREKPEITYPLMQAT